MGASRGTLAMTKRQQSPLSLMTSSPRNSASLKVEFHFQVK